MAIFRNGFSLVLLSIWCVLAAATMSRAEGPRFYLSASIASYHHDAAQEFEEINPGLGLGFSLPITNSGAQIAAEIGGYRNSVGANSAYATGSIDAPVARITKNATLRIGGFAGLAHYENASRKFAGGGVPMIGDWVVVGGAQASVRINNETDIRFRALPAGKAAKVLVTLQVVNHF